ncbi:hypothetical protein ACTA71_000817 [Dictyostelium dimigraforme]
MNSLVQVENRSSCRSRGGIIISYRFSRSNPSSATNSPRTIYYGNETSVENSPFATPLSSPRGPISPRATINSSMSNLQSNIRVEEQWKKIEYYVNDLCHFIYESIRNKDYSNLSELKEKIEEVVNTSKEIEIIHNYHHKQEQERRDQAEKLQKDLIGIKRSYVTTPKSKGTYCIFCGTMETPEWRKDYIMHVVYIMPKILKKENQNNGSPPNPQQNNVITTTTSTSTNSPNPNGNNFSPESAISVSKLIGD